VARYALIDGYLDTMRKEIRWRRDLDDLVSEMEDHLYSTVENLLATGVEPKDAQRDTLDRFGEPKVLAAVYAANNSGGIAVPTKNTIRAGLFSLVAAAMWLGTAALVIYSDFFSGEGDDAWQVFYLVFSVLVLGAGILGLLAAIGVSKRHGGLGTLGMVGLVITGVGVLASVIAWAVPLWMGLQGVGLLILGIVVWGRGIAPKWGTAFVAAGFPIGIITFTVAVAAELGDRDEYGDYPQAWGLGTAVGVSLVAIGLIGWGVWLRNEEPIDIDDDIDTSAITA
jgi:hypothetical protein